MAQQYDYQELIDDLKDEVGVGSLTNAEEIQVLRQEKADVEGYRQILDWYYNDQAMTIELAPEAADSKEETKDKMLLREQYQKDKPTLETLTVEACLAEMFGKTTKETKKGNNKNRNPFF